jgi:hypothetical protein
MSHNENGVRLRITVWDRGDDVEDGRYMAEALSDYGHNVTGNARPTVEQALETVDWSRFLK